MLDSDLADLYGVTTKRLNEQVRRNADRFPEDFAFKLTNQYGLNRTPLSAVGYRYAVEGLWAWLEQGVQ